MRRRTRLTPLALAVLSAAALGGCQDYTFSPVNYSLIQPGTVRVTLSDLSTADLLFVVDDSGSMGGEQQKLAQSFDAFVNALRDTNVARVQAGLDPIDFHVAVTTTSVFINGASGATCQDDCTGFQGQPTCCDNGNRVLRVPRACTLGGGAGQCGAGNACRVDCQTRDGEPTCCSGPGAPPEQQAQGCTTLGAACGQIQTRYGTTRVPASCADPLVTCPGTTTCRTDCPQMSGAQACCDATGLAPACDPGVGAAGSLYPRGDFVRAGQNPRVLHFDKELFCQWDVAAGECLASFDVPTINGNTAALIERFKENVAVGTCGSGQEQPLEAARRAIQKAAARQQPGVADGEWLHVDGQGRPSSKLVVVFVGDEDDCSVAEDPNSGLIFSDPACADDVLHRTPTDEYAAFLTSLGRPVASAFIVSADATSCQDGECGPALCCDYGCTEHEPGRDGPADPGVCTVGGLCGGQGPGVRMLELARTLAVDLGVERVAGSICNPGLPDDPATPEVDPEPGFSSILKRVAEVVKQPLGLQLPTVPALARLTVLRIVDAGGATLKTCAGPAPAGTSGAGLDPYDWWFTSGDDLDPSPTGPSQFIFLNPGPRRCEANPGETYSADYLGKVPSSGCNGPETCARDLGGALEDWRCCTDVDAVGTCIPPPPAQTIVTGTCLITPQ